MLPDHAKRLVDWLATRKIYVSIPIAIGNAIFLNAHQCRRIHCTPTCKGICFHCIHNVDDAMRGVGHELHSYNKFKILNNLYDWTFVIKY